MNATSENVPQFLVVGSQKAGTTTLHSWLERERGVAVPTPKESNYFSSDEVNARGLSWYRSRFDLTGAQVAGEVDPSYLPSLVAPERVRDTVGDIPIIALLRDPLRRAYSQYTHNRYRGRDERTFAQALSEEVESARSLAEQGNGLESWVATLPRRGSDQIGTYIWRGLYSRHIERWGARFSDVHVFLFEELFADSEVGENEYSRLLDAIGYKGTAEGRVLSRRRNETGNARNQTLARMLHDPNTLRPIKSFLKKVLPNPQTRFALRDRLNASGRPPEKMPPAESLPRDARRIFLEDITSLENATGRNLEAWRENLHLS